MLPVEPAFKIYTNLDGTPLDSGYIYFGLVNQNPITAPVTVYWDAAGTQPAAQPLRTQNGYIVRGGTPANVFFSGTYSLLVRDKNQSQVYYSPTSADYSIVDAVNSFIASLAASSGSSLIGFIQAGTGAVPRTAQAKMRERVSVEDFGAIGDGVTVSTTAIQRARESLSSGGVLYFGKGTFIIDTDACLTLNVAGITLEGQGPSTIIKAKNGANLSNIIAITAAGCSVRNMVLDGNRTNSGTSPSVSYGLFNSASNIDVYRVEIRECTRIASFVGSGSAVPSNITYRKCWIHDNGGLDTTTGIGVGIYGGGTFLADNVVIDDCRFENNYNKLPGFPGDSTAMNITATSVTVTNCFLKNNHNVGGGQLALTSDGSTGAPDGRFVVCNNTVVHDVVATGENTTAIEIEGRKVVVSNNVVQSLNGDGVRFETSGGEAVISGNVINCTGTGVNLITVAGTGVRETLISDNRVLTAGTGISVQSGAGVSGIYVIDNAIHPSVPTKIAGAGNCALIRGNFGYEAANQTGVVAGASPYTFPVLNYDALYSCTAVNGMSAAGLNGINVSSAQYVPIPVKAGQQFTVFWAGSAPVYSICSQQ